jgi:hypothetical protein
LHSRYQIINPNSSLNLTRDLAPIALLASVPVILVVNPDSEVHSVADLITLARSAMLETEQLSALIGDIYDAALDPTRWVDVLGKTRAFIGGWAVSIRRWPRRDLQPLDRDKHTA